MRKTMRWLLPIILLFLIPAPARAQQCGVAETITYPVDTDRFQLAQAFAAPSPRHQGRYHTGEDWYAGRDNDYGLGAPVVAAAAGRVTLSSPLGWGRDGGVVIIEHTFADGSLLYTQYGHMMETEAARFPVQWGCVLAGEIIGAVGAARPAPHLHFEARTQNGTSPGPGYSWRMPFADGWRRPAKVIRNWQTWLEPAFRWRLDLADEAGPIAPLLALDDHSLLYLDRNRLGRVTPDGRSLWRINLERSAVSITDLNGRPLLTYADGGMQHVNFDGTLAERWETDVELGRPLVVLADWLIFQTASNGLVAFGADRTQVRWQVDNVPPVVRAQVAGQVIGLITATNELLTLSLGGAILDRANLRDGGGLDSAPNGELRAYTHGGLWTILADGSWALEMEDTPPGGGSGAVLHTDDGDLYLFDGAILYAYDPNRALRWQAALPAGIAGLTRLSEMGEVLLLTSNHGDIIVLQKATGGVCGLTRIFGDDRAGFWHKVGDDGILRVAVSDQILGLDWRALLGGCG